MATPNRNRLRSRTKDLDGFLKVGGLSNHITLLREIIIFPLIYGDVYNKFNVKAARGVLFFGPPGTGKTSVAGALATELNKQGNGKVAFYQRKGADILDKWVGESERKLRDLFNEATGNRPSIIFFDELDGLAPIRSQHNDQVHSSVVTTLLALMDGLDNMPGVIVIGATNRIDAIDPALRRSGRFDKELYFPLPSMNARKEILQVHTQTWEHKPSGEFLTRLSESTAGCCGSDLQALCAEAVVCCLKRFYPNVHRPVMGSKVKINIENITVDEIDFLNATENLVSTSQRLGNYRVRKLSPFIKPLLQRQLDKIVRYIQLLLPQFTQPFKKFVIGNERYAGRFVLKGTNQQGLTVHIVPAILQTLEHIPCYMLEIPALFESNIRNAKQNLPSILVLSRVDDWWDLIDSDTQLGLTAMLEDLHAGLPLFLIATCRNELPVMLQDYFYSNSSIVIKLEDPTQEEREQFLVPLFFGNKELSVNTVLKNFKSLSRPIVKMSKKDKPIKRQSQLNDSSPSPAKRFKGEGLCDKYKGGNTCNSGTHNYCKNARNRILESPRRISSSDIIDSCQDIYSQNTYPSEGNSRLLATVPYFPKYNMNQTLMDMISSNSLLNCTPKQEPISETSLPEYQQYDTDSDVSDVFNLWKRASHVSSDGLPVGQLELLYDTIASCISINRCNFHELIQALERTLENLENSCTKHNELD